MHGQEGMMLGRIYSGMMSIFLNSFAFLFTSSLRIEVGNGTHSEDTEIKKMWRVAKTVCKMSFPSFSLLTSCPKICRFDILISAVLINMEKDNLLLI